MAAQGPPPALARDPVIRPLIVDYLRKLIRVIPPGVQLVSWYRDADHNATVGGHPESQHLYALATDWTGDPLALRRFELFAEFAGLHAVSNTNRLHIQRYPAGALSAAGFPFPPRV